MSTKAKESSINSSKYSTNENYNRIGSKETRSRLDTTSIGYHQKKERIIAMANIEMATSDNSYDNKKMRSIVDKPSKEQTYNNTLNNENTVHNNYKVVVVTNYEYGSKIIGEGDTEIYGENEKDVVEANVAEKGEEIKNNNKTIAPTKSIGKYKMVTYIIQKEIKKRKIIKETIINNGNIWKKMGNERHTRENIIQNIIKRNTVEIVVQNYIK